jgi:hypothetical protein
MDAQAGVSAKAGMSAQALIAASLADPRTAWSMGSFGALAEFMRDADEPAEVDACSVRTARGAIRIDWHERARAFAYEVPSADGRGWRHGIALCLPADDAKAAGRTLLTELGPDARALAAGDRDAVVFDLGLGLAQTDLCVRTADAAMLAALRAHAGERLLAPASGFARELAARSPHRVACTALGRIEVYQPIPPADARTPEGPHTHLLPDLIASGRAHAADVPIPAGWLPCAEIHPPAALRDALGRAQPFDGAAHRAFQALLGRFGDPAALDVKARVWRAVRAGKGPEAAPTRLDRAGRAARRVALRQLIPLDGDSPVLAAWRKAFDRPGATAAAAH